MSLDRLLADGESNDESSAQSNNEQPLRLFSSEAKVEMLQRLIEPAVEDFIHRLVRDGTALAIERLRSLNRNAGNEILTSRQQILKLQFVNKTPLMVFTRNKIKGEDSAPIKIALVDGLTGQDVKSGPVASARVEIVVLAGDFDGIEGDDWTVEEFESKIVKAMKGRKSILKGNELNLKEGFGLVSELSFTHNSNNVKNCKLRLGAKVVGDFNGIRVKEAKTEPFTLKDFRATYRNKHESPSLNDEVWRLKNIRKNGAFHKRLIEANINTVRDFRLQLSMDPERLQKMYNGGDKMWMVIVRHAQECIIDKTVYAVGEVQGLLLQNQYVPLNEISQIQKADAHKAVVSAFKHRKDVDEGELINDSSNLFIDNEPSNSTRLEAPSGSHLSTINIVDHEHVANIFSPFCLSPNNSLLEEVWAALDMAKCENVKKRRKWNVVCVVLKFLTNKRTVAIDDTHISKKIRCF